MNRSVRTRFVRRLVVTGGILTLVAGGCASSSKGSASRAYEAGDFEAAFVASQKKVSTIGPGHRNEVWMHLEAGKMAQDAGHWAESIAAFDRAINAIEHYDQRFNDSGADTVDGIMALMLDERTKVYEPTPCDRIFAHTAQMVNYAMLGDLQAASAHARSQIYVQEVLRKRNARLREEMDDVLIRQRNGNATRSERAASKVMNKRDTHLRDLKGVIDQRYVDTLGPYGYYVGSVILRAAGDPAGHAELADRLIAFAPNSGAAQLVDGKNALDPHVYVLFENGLAPERVKATIVEPGLPDAIAVPDLQLRLADRSQSLRVSGDSGSVMLEPVGSVDSAVATDFHDRLWQIWGRPILSAIIKAAAAEGAAQAMDEDDRWLPRVLGGAAILAAEADTRIWRSLPGEQLAAELPRPASGVVTLELRGATGAPTTHTVSLPEGNGPVLLYVRSTRSGVLTAHAAPLGSRVAVTNAQ